MGKKDIRRYSLTELEDMVARGDYTPTRPDAPEYEPDEDFWKNARIVMPGAGKTHTGLRIDNDVLGWFKAQGRGWQTRMNAVLRSHVALQQTKKPHPRRK